MMTTAAKMPAAPSLYSRAFMLRITKYVSGGAGIFAAIVIIATFVAGAQLITWCGEQIDDKGIDVYKRQLVRCLSLWT